MLDAQAFDSVRLSVATRPEAALLVDVGGVLLLLNGPELVSVTAQHGGVDTEEAFMRANYAAHNAAHPAKGPLRDYYAIFGEFAGVPSANRAAFEADYRAASRRRNMWHSPDARSKAALSAFKAAGTKVAIVSQADGTIAQMLLDAQMCQEGDGPGVSVDAVLDSEIVGFDKPDPRLFLLATERLGLDPANAVHVGDTVPADVRGAHAAGMLAVHYDPYDDCDAPGDHEHVRTLIEAERFLS
jgi:putative hydrolase of the HAD superfamily